MLVLSRKLNERIVIDGGIRITIVGVRGNQVRLGIEAPDRVKVFREELCLPVDSPAEDDGPRAVRPKATSYPEAIARPLSPAR
jgi:carbon storage regulator